MNKEIIEKVNEVFVENFELDPDELKATAHIFMDLGLDSLDIVDLVVSLQQKFGVQIRNDERIRSIRTLEDLYLFIEQLKDEGVGQ